MAPARHVIVAGAGIGGLTGLAILIPFTFDMDPVPAFAMLLGMIAVTNTSDSVTAILLGTLVLGERLAPQHFTDRPFTRQQNGSTSVRLTIDGGVVHG